MLREHMLLPMGNQLTSVVLSLRNDLDALQQISTLAPCIGEDRPNPFLLRLT
ncbi:MAG: hypothetical protein HOE79_00880 [Euryarchaeota archaeon]|nr:hypothetical protein [Euryarchaeota archaeon]